MSLVIYGHSDDLLEFEGDIEEEAHSYELPIEVRCSDGTVLRAEYAPDELAVWRLTLVKAGPLFVHIDECEDENNTIASDVAYFVSDMEWLEWRTPETDWTRCNAKAS